MTVRYLLLFFLLCPALLPAAQPIDSFEYSSPQAAQAVWQPMTGSPQVSPSRAGGRPCLKLPCDFASTKAERVSWDRQVNLDLTAADGVAFEIFARDPSPVSYFSIYFQTGGGWFHGAFFPESNGGWQTIVIRKSEMTPEGRPGGWDKVKTIRISAWRGSDVDTEIFVHDLRPTGLLGSDSLVAVIRGDYASKAIPTEARAISDAAERVADALERVDIRCVRVSDESVTAEQLRRAKLVVLPYNPSLPASALSALKSYIRSSGKVMFFYSIPGDLYGPLGVKDGPVVRADLEGRFAAMRVKPNNIPGSPTEAKQLSWNIRALQALPGTSAVCAEWVDKDGKPSGYPAAILSTNCAAFTHVLLPDDVNNKARLLLALAVTLSPETGKQAAEATIARIGQLAGYGSYEQARDEIARLAPRKNSAQSALRAAATARDKAVELSRQQRWAQARESATLAQQKLLQAYCLAQNPQTNEFRAFWCHSAFGVRDLSWDEAIRRLAENGMNAVLPNMLWGGVAFYDSAVLPVAPQVKERGDQIEQCLKAARKYGVQVHVWKVNWNLGSAAPKEFVERMRKEGRLQASQDGKEEPWLCPSHPVNQKLEVDSMVEVARKYDIDGIHFDYIRYPDGEHCFCAGCKDRFGVAMRGQLKNWPADALKDGPLRTNYLDWRRNNINLVVAEVARQVKALKPNLKISAAVFRNWNTDRDGVGQDWKLWCDRGWLDFVCPMNYTPSNNSFENVLRKQLQWAGKVPCYPGIGYSASSSYFGPDRAIEQINLARKHHTGGFVIFNYGVTECRDLLPLLGMGVTAVQGEP